MLVDPEEMTRPRKLAQNFLGDLVDKGLSGRKALSELRDKGIGYRTADFYDDWNYWQDAVSNWKGMRYTPDNLQPREFRYVDTEIDIPTKYSTRCEVKFRDVDTGEIKKTYRYVGHTHLEAGREVEDLTQQKTAGEIKEAAVQSAEVGSPQPNAEIIGAIPERGFRRL